MDNLITKHNWRCATIIIIFSLTYFTAYFAYKEINGRTKIVYRYLNGDKKGPDKEYVENQKRLEEDRKKLIENQKRLEEEKKRREEEAEKEKKDKWVRDLKIIGTSSFFTALIAAFIYVIKM